MPADVGYNIHGSKVNRQSKQIILVAMFEKRASSRKFPPSIYYVEAGVVKYEGQKVVKDLACHDNSNASFACQPGPSIARNDEELEHDEVT
jgi:hypothetical protein